MGSMHSVKVSSVYLAVWTQPGLLLSATVILAVRLHCSNILEEYITSRGHICDFYSKFQNKLGVIFVMYLKDIVGETNL